MITPAPTDPKAAWRRWARRVRATVDFTVVSPAVCSALRRHGLGGVVVTYLPMGDEVDLRPLLELPGVSWAATRTPPSGPLRVHRLTADVEVHPYGFTQPAATAPPVALDDVTAVLVPGLAFDRRGGRLGRGAGYYDGLLAQLGPGVETIGIAPAAVVVDELPHEEHDRRVSLLATEHGVSPTSGPPPR